MKNKLYNELAKYYDLIYSNKPYSEDVKYQNSLIKKYKKSKGKDFLEVACGTGRYLEIYEKKYDCVGIDLNEGMLSVAKKRVKKAKLLQGNMIDFKLNKQFDVIVCLFSSIGYIHKISDLNKTVQNFADHLKPGGVIIISPWLSKKAYKAGTVYLGTYRDEKISLARMTTTKLIKKNISVLNYKWMIGEKNKEIRIIENDRHELAMHDKQDYLKAFQKAGLTGKFILNKPEGRGLYVATKKS